MRMTQNIDKTLKEILIELKINNAILRKQILCSENVDVFNMRDLRKEIEYIRKTK